MTQAIIALPKPPSVNAAYGNRKKGSPGRGRYPTRELIAWRNLARAEVMAAGKMPRFAGAVTIDILIDDGGNNRREDADNRMKPAIDLLVEMGIIIDDSKKIVRRVSCAWGSGKPGMIEVTVREVSGYSFSGPFEKPKGDKAWAIKQLKRRFGIDIHPNRIHL